MNCDKCDCANQPVLIQVKVPFPRHDVMDSMMWREKHWCYDCVHLASVDHNLAKDSER